MLTLIEKLRAELQCRIILAAIYERHLLLFALGRIERICFWLLWYGRGWYRED